MRPGSGGAGVGARGRPAPGRAPMRLGYGLRQRPADADGPRFPLIRSSALLMSAGATIPVSFPSANTSARPSEHALSRGSRSATGSSGVALATSASGQATPRSVVRARSSAGTALTRRTVTRPTVCPSSTTGNAECRSHGSNSCRNRSTVADAGT